MSLKINYMSLYNLYIFNRVRLFVTSWSVAYQAPLSMGFSRQENWSGLPCPPPGDLLDSGIGLVPFKSPAFAGGFSLCNILFYFYFILSLVWCLLFFLPCYLACGILFP